MIRDNVGNGKIFCHLKELSIKENEPFPHYPHEVINLDGEVLALKIGRANGS